MHRREMMPQAMTPLTLDALVTNLAGLGQAMRKSFIGFAQDSYGDVFVTTFCKHFFGNMYSGLYMANEYTIGIDTKSAKDEADVMLFGSPIGGEHLTAIHTRYKNSYVPWYRKIMAILQLHVNTLRTNQYLRRSNVIISSINTDFSSTDPVKIHKELAVTLLLSGEAWNCHSHATNASSITSVSDWNKAVDWLRSDESDKLKQDFATFMEIHGHRCVRESELSEKPWAVEPAKVVRTIQDMTKSADQLRETKKHITEEEALDKIKSPIGLIKKKIVRFLLPLSRSAVGQRENGKRLAIKGMDILRQGYNRLAELLVHEGRLPDKELIFYFTHDEIGELIKTRSARLINKAIRRRKMMPALMAMEFPELITGYPTPVSEDDAISVPTTGELRGMPVSHGVVRARCRVVKSLEEANRIEQGEILIVPYTDIGWSPYFPLVSGLCTEMGGLLSHGAVVAREYGLPCIVSAKKATHVFRTGDDVILNGTLGTIAKVTPESPEEDAVDIPQDK
ncbi:PREDICTED: putative phosphoenolpyruvate synthase [Priapulus caudatus]|uniref:Phosphoenolpyruvate synthase n=1 Tax=Priapulus caudatus TaxID=37621 RepID=A0ABM1FAY3_PRICU|nr:PREDICTED: putative phosphoenolpyruvate synthase [Priapulus caudatus]